MERLCIFNKTVAAASAQIQAVERLKSHGGLESLPPDLYEMAVLRLEHPEYSLRELGEALDPPLSRSGVNHRLRRLTELAGALVD